MNRRKLLKAGAIAAGLGTLGFLVAASGVVPIKASSGHWPITEWFLQFAKKRSVATHAAFIETPPLDDPDQVLKGAGHYELGCHPCHGGPDELQPRIVQAMTPQPPYVPLRIRKWKARELFYLVKHGIKLTGMPAWPADGRDDEVWAVVAFLLAMPELDATEYRRLALGETGAPAELETGPDFAPLPRAVADTCGRCHGADGTGRGTGAFPKLAGQKPGYTYRALRAYAERRRHSGIMGPVADGLRDETMREVALYYAGLGGGGEALGGGATVPPGVAAAIHRGEAIAARGVPERKIPSCADCHGPFPTERNPAYPLLAGQHADYLVLQLELFARGERGGSGYAHLMDEVAPKLAPAERRDVALYYASLGGGLEELAP